MKVIILAAGYATRLYPLTLNCPKPLLKIAGKPMLDHILESLSPVEGIEEVIIVTNSKFSGHFREWASKTEFRFMGKKPRVIDDLTTEDKSATEKVKSFRSMRSGRIPISRASILTMKH